MNRGNDNIVQMTPSIPLICGFSSCVRFYYMENEHSTALNHYLVEKATVWTFFYFLKFYTDISPLKYKPVIKLEPCVLPVNMQIPTCFGPAIVWPALGSRKSHLTWHCNSFLLLIWTLFQYDGRWKRTHISAKTHHSSFFAFNTLLSAQKHCQQTLNSTQK